jgi:predicted P-loop ATPase
MSIEATELMDDILSSTGDRKTKSERIEEAMKEKYQYRYNTIKCQAEYKDGPGAEWRPMGKIVVNDMKRYLDRAGLSTSTAAIKEILHSSFSTPVNPIQSFILELPKYNPKTHDDVISQIADCVDTGSEHWNWIFKKWFVALVANAMNDYGCQNQASLTLAGAQGVYKSTFFAHLLPQELSSYVFIGKPKDTQDERAWSQLLSEFILVCMDDCLKGILKKDNESIKSYITQGVIKFRRMYDEFYSEPPRLASIAATVNGNDILNDMTGSRRFLTFEVKSLDVERYKRIDKSKALAQALYLYKDKFKFWFDKKEEAIIEQQNSLFTIVSMEDTFNHTHCLIDDYAHMQPGEIVSKLQELTRINYLSPIRIGEALKKLGFRRYQKTVNANRVWGWNVQISDTPISRSNEAN